MVTVSDITALGYLGLTSVCIFQEVQWLPHRHVSNSLPINIYTVSEILTYFSYRYQPVTLKSKHLNPLHSSMLLPPFSGRSGQIWMAPWKCVSLLCHIVDKQFDQWNTTCTSSLLPCMQVKAESVCKYELSNHQTLIICLFSVAYFSYTTSNSTAHTIEIITMQDGLMKAKPAKTSFSCSFRTNKHIFSSFTFSFGLLTLTFQKC